MRDASSPYLTVTEDAEVEVYLERRNTNGRQLEPASGLTGVKVLVAATKGGTAIGTLDLDLTEPSTPSRLRAAHPGPHCSEKNERGACNGGGPRETERGARSAPPFWRGLMKLYFNYARFLETPLPLDINVRAVALGIRAALPALEAADGGAIVVTGSVSGLFGDSGLWAYNASKAAVVNLVRSVALDIGHLGIRINAVCPGPVRTAMTANVAGTDMERSMQARLPLQRFGDPAEIANVISFLASTEASFVTGAELPVDGGVTCGTGQWATTGGRRAGFL